MGRPKKTVRDYEREAVKVGRCLVSKHGVARKIYQMRHGSLPRHIYVCHKCDNGLCIRDSHHFPGTQKENVHDSIRKNRMANEAWRKVVSKRAKKQHKRGQLGRKTWRPGTDKIVNQKLRESGPERGKIVKELWKGEMGAKLRAKHRSFKTRKRHQQAALKRFQDPKELVKISGKNHWNYGGPGTMLGRKWKPNSPGRKKLSRLMKQRNKERRLRNL